MYSRYLQLKPPKFINSLGNLLILEIYTKSKNHIILYPGLVFLQDNNTKNRFLKFILIIL